MGQGILGSANNRAGRIGVDGHWCPRWVCRLGDSDVYDAWCKVSDMPRRVLGVLPVISSVVFVTGGFVLLWSYLAAVFYPPITFGPLMGEMRPSVVPSGGYARLCRDIEIHRSAEYDLTRTLSTKLSDGTTLQMEFGNTSVAHEAKKLTPQCRILKIPDALPEGYWVLETWVSYTAWPFWHMRLTTPPVEFYVAPPLPRM